MKANFAGVRHLEFFVAVGASVFISSPALACQIDIWAEGRGSLYGGWPWSDVSISFEGTFTSYSSEKKYFPIGLSHGCKRILGYDPNFPQNVNYFHGIDCNLALRKLIPSGRQIVNLSPETQLFHLTSIPGAWSYNPRVTQIEAVECVDEPPPDIPPPPSPPDGGDNNDDCPDIAVRVYALPARRITVRYRCD